MSKNSKAYREAAEKVDRDSLYTPLEAAKLAKETSSKKQDATVEVAIRLGVDPRKADQMVRGTVNLPHGTGKTARVVVFAVGDKADEATAAGADDRRQRRPDREDPGRVPGLRRRDRDARSDGQGRHASPACSDRVA